jgi:hypothetical protein
MPVSFAPFRSVLRFLFTYAGAPGFVLASRLRTRRRAEPDGGDDGSRETYGREPRAAPGERGPMQAKAGWEPSHAAHPV